MNDKTTARAAVRDAWDFLLDQQPVTVSDLIESAVKNAVTHWLDDNEYSVLDAITEGARRADLDLDSATDVRPGLTQWLSQATTDALKAGFWQDAPLGVDEPWNVAIRAELAARQAHQ